MSDEITDLREANGEIIIKIYDDYLSWMFDNYVSMEIFRYTFCFMMFVVIPITGFGIYRWYWWSLYQNIYVPPNRIEQWW